jgi:hypothetical protein
MARRCSQWRLVIAGALLRHVVFLHSVLGSMGLLLLVLLRYWYCYATVTAPATTAATAVSVFDPVRATLLLRCLCRPGRAACGSIIALLT